MFTLKNESIKAVIAVIILLVVFSLLIVFSVNEGVAAWAAEPDMQEHEEKIYCNATIEDNFDPSCVLVVMDKYTGGINKQHKGSFFGEFPKGYIKDLTYIDGDIATKKYFDVENFNQILKIELVEKSKKNVINVIRQIEKIDGIKWVGPNRYWNPTAQPAAADGQNYALQWGLHGSNGIDAESAWNITTGNNNVRVGVIDSGIANHPDLSANLVTGKDFVNGNTTTDDDVTGHGTHIAGIIGATGANVYGVTGVNWNVQLVPLQVSNADGEFVDAAVAEAITWALNRNIGVLNFSGGGYSEYSPLTVAINKYKGLFVCGAGNGGGDYIGDDNDRIHFYPSDYSSFSNRIISVGSINSAGNRAISSNFGDQTVSLFAPGEAIFSTVPTTVNPTGYETWSGTSMAAPFVTGTAALMLALIESKPHDMTPDQISALIKSTIISSVDLNPSLSGYCVSGGHLNANDALHDLPLIKQAFSDFGYNGSTYYWNGKVDMIVDMAYLCEANSSNTIVFNGNTALDFVLETVSSNNLFSQINGTVSFQLKNSSGTIIQIEESNTHVSTVNVSIWGAVTLGNKTFRINTWELSGNDTYTLTLTSVMNRGSWTDTDTKTFTFIVDIETPCVAEGTLITLADGSQVAVELLTMEDMLLVWNHQTGAFDAAPILFIDNDSLTEYEIIHLFFSDGTEVKTIYEHGFWNATLNKYVFIRSGEATQYIGDWFNKQTYDGDGNMIWGSVQLADVQIYTQQTTAWSPVTFSHLNYYVNGMLSMPGATEGLINIFEVDADTMQYDAASFAADIATYGLYSYEEFAEIFPIPEVIFDAFNGQYLKVSIGKGLIDMDSLAALIERYAEFFPEEDTEASDDQNGQDNGNHNGHHNGHNNGNHNGHGNGNNNGHGNGHNNGNHNGHHGRGRQGR